jgi:hypothetical protein
MNMCNLLLDDANIAAVRAPRIGRIVKSMAIRLNHASRRREHPLIEYFAPLQFLLSSPRRR